MATERSATTRLKDSRWNHKAPVVSWPIALVDPAVETRPRNFHHSLLRFGHAEPPSRRRQRLDTRGILRALEPRAETVEQSAALMRRPPRQGDVRTRFGEDDGIPRGSDDLGDSPVLGAGDGGFTELLSPWCFGIPACG